MRNPLIAALVALVVVAACRSNPVAVDAAFPDRPLSPTPAHQVDLQPLALPYAELEAEAGDTSGVRSAVSTVLHTAGAEASGRRFVSLAPGDKVRWLAPVAGDTLVVRYSLPDSADGSGQNGVLKVGVGEAAAVDLAITSRYNWEYGTPHWGTNSVWSDGPSASLPRHFWDEASVRTSAYTAGTAVWVGNPPDSGVTVLVDLADFEAAGAAVVPPTGARTFVGDTTGATDVTAAFQAFVNGGGTVFVPEGTYQIGSIDVGAVTIQGAGLWRTRFVGPLSRFHFTGGVAHLADFAVFGETSTRNDNSDAGNGLAGVPASGSTVARLWIEHKKCAFWFGNWGSASGPTGITLTACRFRDLMADAVNLCSGTTNTVVEDCLVRNSGDDGLAAWSPQIGTNPVGGNNTFRRNLVQMPWVASGIALYGGGGFTVEDNVVKDTVTTGSGLYLASSFTSWAFQGTISLSRNLFIRCGAHESDPGGATGAIRLIGDEKPLSGATIGLTDNTVVDPLEAAVSVQGGQSIGAVTVSGLKVTTTASVPVTLIRAGSTGSLTFSSTTLTGPATWSTAPTGFTLTHD